MLDRIAPSEFDEAVAWAREEVNSEGHRALGIGFEIADASTGTSKMAYPDLTGREGTAFLASSRRPPWNAPIPSNSSEPGL